MTAPEHFEERVLEAHMRLRMLGKIDRDDDYDDDDNGWDLIASAVMADMRVVEMPQHFTDIFKRLEDYSHTCLICGVHFNPMMEVMEHRRLHHRQVSFILGFTPIEPSWDYTDLPKTLILKKGPA